MPSHRVHRLIDRVFLGREYPEVHRYLDEPYKWLGPRHRVLRHDLLTVLSLAAVDPAYGASALLHILADYGSSYLKKKRGRDRRWRRSY